MSYIYKEFKNGSEIDNFFEQLNDRITLPIKEWHKEKGLVLYGFIDKDNHNLPNYAIICFGKTITPQEVAKMPNVGIFANLKKFGSSKKYKGLRDIRGNVLLENIYEEITILCEYDNDVLLLIKKNGLNGVAKASSNGEEVTVIVSPKYEKIFDAQEYTLGFVENGVVGFMDMDGKIVLPPLYKDIEGNNIFINGKAEIQRVGDYTIPCYINHYGNYVQDAYDYGTNTEHNFGTSYYPYGDLPSALDAYEGDDSNRWNTD